MQRFRFHTAFFRQGTSWIFRSSNVCEVISTAKPEVWWIYLKYCFFRQGTSSVLRNTCLSCNSDCRTGSLCVDVCKLQCFLGKGRDILGLQKCPSSYSDCHTRSMCVDVCFFHFLCISIVLCSIFLECFERQMCGIQTFFVGSLILPACHVLNAIDSRNIFSLQK